MGREQFKSARMRALELSGKREEIEVEISAIVSDLEAPGGPGVSGNLVDAEGFPRADIDIHAVRSKRHRLAVLKTDLKTVTKQLEEALQEALPPAADDDEGATASTTPPSTHPTPPAPAPVASASSRNGSGNGNDAARASTGSNDVTPQDRLRPPFCVVDNVAPQSPASEAGIQVNDRVVVFGAISLRSSHSVGNAMRSLGATVREHEGRPLDLIVHRGMGSNMQCIKLTITPRRWSGNGLLGCHVVPARPEDYEMYKPDVATAVMER